MFTENVSRFQAPRPVTLGHFALDLNEEVKSYYMYTYATSETSARRKIYK